MLKSQIHKFFNPETIAVIGANNRENSVGYSVFRNIKKSKFKGRVFPVNINSETVQGSKAYASILDIKEKIDLAIVATPAFTVPNIVKECGKAKVAGVTIISSGFREAGPKGQKMFDEIKKTAKNYGIRILGPNCLGFINPKMALNASFAPEMPLAGKIAFISQSGALCNAFLDWSIKENIGFAYFVSIGSMADISFDELIDYFNEDPGINSILLYMESVLDAEKFMKSARAFTRNKPMVVLKGGVGDTGVKAVSSHTGTVAGDEKVFTAAFKRAGIIQTDAIDKFFDFARAFNNYKKPKGNKLAIITNAGGPAVISNDFLISHNGCLAEISRKTVNHLDKFLAPAWSRGNPIDLLGDARPEHYEKALKACLEEKGIDGILIILTPQAVTETEEIARKIALISRTNEKPVFASFMGEKLVQAGIKILQQSGIPVFRTPEQAIRCFVGISEWQKRLKIAKEIPEKALSCFAPGKTKVSKIMEKAVRNKEYVLTGTTAKKVLECYGMPVNPSFLAKTQKEAEKIAEKIGFPLIMKIEAKGLLHKTEINGVRLRINSQEEAVKTFKEMMVSAKKHLKSSDIEGISLEKTISKKFELIVGSKKDSIFGPVIAFGMGGVAVEVFKDVAIGLPPLNMALAEKLMEETKIYTLLKGYRNLKGADLKAIRSFLCRFSCLLADFPQIKDIDINPLAADEKGVIALDAKIIFEHN